MNYKKIKKDNYTLHLINTDRFKEINVSINLTKKYNKEEAVYLKLLEKVLISNGTKKYRKLKEISRTLENLYRSDIGVRFTTFSTNMTFELKLNLINPKYTTKEMYTETFKLFKEVITSPYIKDNKFEEKNFELEKENLIKSIMNIKDISEVYGRIKFEEIFFKGTPYEDNNYKNIELFKQIENEKLYETYKKLFTDYKIDVFIIGCLEEKTLENLTDDLLKNFKQTINIDNVNIKIKNKETKETKEQTEATQSNLFLGLTIDNITEDEKNYTAVLYNTILGRMNNSVLFVKVREDNSLCYSIGSSFNRYTSSIVIDAGISKKNYEKSLELIKECLKLLEDKKEVEKNIENAKKTLDISYNDYYDNINKIVNYYYINEISYLPSIEERRKRINEITPEEISEFAKKIKIKNIFLLEGVQNEEN